MRKLNLGCGETLLEGFVNVDLNSNCDVRHDLNKYPFPFVDDSFDFILVSHVIEHLFNPNLFIMECHRVLKKGGKIVFKCPVSSFGVNHLRTSYHKGSFHAYYNDMKVGQSGTYFELVYEKRRLRKFFRLYFKFRNWFLNLFSDEWEYCLKKI